MTNIDYVKIPVDGYYLNQKGIRDEQKRRNSTYMGYWCVKQSDGGWTEIPVDVFYVENPDKEKGHSHYYGIFCNGSGCFITNAESAFSETISGIRTDSGEVIVSRYRHDYIEKDGHVIDGGRDYFRGSLKNLVAVTVIGSRFIIKDVT